MGSGSQTLARVLWRTALPSRPLPEEEATRRGRAGGKKGAWRWADSRSELTSTRQKGESCGWGGGEREVGEDARSGWEVSAPGIQCKGVQGCDRQSGWLCTASPFSVSPHTLLCFSKDPSPNPSGFIYSQNTGTTYTGCSLREKHRSPRPRSPSPRRSRKHPHPSAAQSHLPWRPHTSGLVRGPLASISGHAHINPNPRKHRSSEKSFSFPPCSSFLPLLLARPVWKRNG